MPNIESALGGYRVLDLTDEKGLFCGKILADLGADVIKIEKPGGDPARNIGPFYGDTPDPQKSLFWFAYNVNKRGVTLDIETPDGKELFRRLVKTADCVVESFDPGYLDELSLGYKVLNRLNSRIILTSITPFGQTGLYKDYKGADIVLWGMGGIMYLCGDPDRPPVQVSFPQAYLTGAAEAAAETMVAVYYQEATGKGQHVDVSIHASIPWLTMEGVEFWPMLQVNVKRKGVLRENQGNGSLERQIWRCKDGYVHFSIYGGQVAERFMPGLIKWLEEDGAVTETLKQINWADTDLLHLSQEECDAIVSPLETFLKKRTRAEIYEGTKKHRALVYPVNSPADMIEDPQLKARGFWEKLEHADLDAKLTYPGAFAKLSKTPIKVRHPAPRIGEHNEDLYLKELGLSSKELVRLKQSGVI